MTENKSVNTSHSQTDKDSLNSADIHSDLRTIFAQKWHLQEGGAFRDIGYIELLPSPAFGVFLEQTKVSPDTMEFQIVPTLEPHDSPRLQFVVQGGEVTLEERFEPSDWEYDDFTTKMFDRPFKIGQTSEKGFHQLRDVVVEEVARAIIDGYRTFKPRKRTYPNQELFEKNQNELDLSLLDSSSVKTKLIEFLNISLR